MREERIVKVAYHFHGISVLVPRQHEKDILAMDKGTFLPKGFQNMTHNFTLIRLIANIALVRKVDYDMGIMDAVTTFDPPIQLRVGYSITDVMETKGNIQRLKLAYWDGSQWVILSNTHHDYLILPPGTGQVAEATIPSWVGDPPLAWGK